MAWVTRVPYAAPVVVRDGLGLYGTQYPFGVLLNNGNLRVYYATGGLTGGTGYGSATASRDSTDKGATWSVTERFDNFDIADPLDPQQSDGIAQIRRGRSGRLHAAILLRQFHGDTSIFPSQPGWVVQYVPYYAYSDDEGETFSTLEAVPYGGYAAVGMDVAELSNGDVAYAWYGNGPDPGPGPYTENVPYYDCKVSVKSAATGTWSVGGVIGSYLGPLNAMGAYCVEPQIDVIHDGSTYGRLVAHFHTENGPPQSMWICVSVNGGASFSTPVFAGSGSNRGGLCVTADGDVIFTYFDWGTFQAVYRVSQDAGATFSAATSVVSGSFQPSAGGTGGFVGNKWVSPFIIDGAGVTPNLGITWGSGSDDVHGSTFFRSWSRGATALSTPLSIVTTPVWSLSALTVTITHAPALIRSQTIATVYSAAGGVIRFDGPHADRFTVSLTGASWGSTLTVPAGTSSILLGVTPQASDSVLSASVGIPV